MAGTRGKPLKVTTLVQRGVKYLVAHEIGALPERVYNDKGRIRVEVWAKDLRRKGMKAVDLRDALERKVGLPFVVDVIDVG